MFDTMNSDDINLLQEFSNLSTSLAEDESSERVRALIKYLKESSLNAQQLRIGTTDPEEKNYANLLQEAFDASVRIVTGVWESMHLRSLD